MDVELRPPSPADGERLARMHYASWRDAYASFLPPEFWGDATELRWISRWTERLRSPDPSATILIAVHDGEIAGFATVGPARQNPTAGAPARDRELWASPAISHPGRQKILKIIPAGLMTSLECRT